MVAAMRRQGACAVMCILAMVVPISCQQPVFGQEQGGTLPGSQDGEFAALEGRIGGLEERIGKLETSEEERDQFPAMTISIAIAASIVASTHSAYLVKWLSRHRFRPILSWSMSDGGVPFETRDMPGGIRSPLVRVANVGQVAAVDIVGYIEAPVSSTAKRTTMRRPPHYFGALHPGASAQIAVPLEPKHHEKVMAGATMAFELFLKYKTVDGQHYTYRVAGVYSLSVRALRGAASKALPL